MNYSQLIDHIKASEGFRAHPYRDTVGKLTIGYGRNLDDVGIDEDEAEHLLRSDLMEALAGLSRINGYQQLDPVRQMALADMAYNMGLPALMQFVRMWAALRSGDYQEAADEMVDSRWYGQVGRRAEKLVQVMRSGVWA